jgi:hypothetical protein
MRPLEPADEGALLPSRAGLIAMKEETGADSIDAHAELLRRE